jgi:serine/arginine repetitive matrix protein 1
LNKVQLDLIKIWIERRIEELIGDEDEILNNYAISIIEDAIDKKEDLCPMKMQISLTGFLEDNSSVFMEELWALFLSAQT